MINRGETMSVLHNNLHGPGIRAWIERLVDRMNHVI